MEEEFNSENYDRSNRSMGSHKPYHRRGCINDDDEDHLLVEMPHLHNKEPTGAKSIKGMSSLHENLIQQKHCAEESKGQYMLSQIK